MMPQTDDQRARYWRRVEEAADIFNLQRELVYDLRSDIELLPQDQQELFYHAEPFDIARDLSGTSEWSPDQIGQYLGLATDSNYAVLFQTAKGRGGPLARLLIETQRKNEAIAKEIAERQTLEKDKLEIERHKLRLQENHLQIALYLEDFKARWQELLNFENENNRWTSLYVTALILVIGWVLNNIGKYSGLEGLFATSDNAYFIMAIAIVNAIYTFAIAFKGYQIQQIAQYQYEFLGERIWQMSGMAFNEWERYRRERFGNKRGPELIRSAYFVVISLVPTIISYTLIVLYWVFQWNAQAQLNQWRSIRNWFSIAAFILVTLSLILSVLTSQLNRRWRKILEKTSHRMGQS